MVLVARIRILTVAVMFLVLAAMAPAWAQKLGPDGAPNPTASVTSERTLLQQAPRIEGRIDIPDSKAAVLIQPAGRTWDYLHEVLLHWGGSIVIVGTIVVLGAATFNLFYSFLGGLLMFAGLYGFGLWATKRDPYMLRILLASSQARRRYDAGKHDAVDVEIVPW